MTEADSVNQEDLEAAVLLHDRLVMEEMDRGQLDHLLNIWVAAFLRIEDPGAISLAAERIRQAEYILSTKGE